MNEPQISDTSIVRGREAGSDRGPRVALIVESVHHDNTRKIAHAMAHALEADVLSPEEITADGLTEYDVVGFGSGIYFGRHHSSIIRLVKSVDRLPCRVFIFSTAGLPWLRRLFHWALRRALLRKGCFIIGEFSCRGWDTVGPLLLVGGLNRRHPDFRDVERATQFADDLRRQADVAA